MDLVDAASPIGCEQPAAQHLHERFTKLGLKTWLQEVETNRSNVIGVLEGEGEGPTLLFLGHLDTTWSGQEERIRDLGPGYQPKSWREDDWIYGMGAYNMKSGLAASIEAVEAIIASGCRLRGDIVLAGVVGETCNAQVGRFQGARYRGAGVGTRFLLNNGVTADLCVNPEPTNGRIGATTGGYVFLELTTKGNPGATYVRGAAGTEVKPAVDAIAKMDIVKAAILEWKPHYMEAHRYKGEIATPVAIVAIEGGFPYRVSKLAPFCRLSVEIGIMPGQHPLDVIQEIKGLLRKLQGHDHNLDVDVHVVQAIPGSVVAPDEYLVKGLAAAHEAEYGKKPDVTFDSWLADTTSLTRYGIPAVCYGPAGRMRGGGGTYYAKEGEQCYLPDMTLGARTMARFAADVCARSRQEFLEMTPKWRGTVVV
jgi:acetylornithine deacetylase/succinyl-diaminopimelate desuccinylase-like protein